MTLDLRKPRGQKIFLSLAAMSDAVIENFRVGQFLSRHAGSPAGHPGT